MLERVKAIANAPLPAPPACSDRVFAQNMRIMETALKRRVDDEVSGRLLLNTYRRMLGGYSEAAINHLAQTAIETLDWFPTVAECKRIIAAWERNDEPVQAKRLAFNAYGREMQARLDDALTRLADGAMTQDEIDALPDRWKRIAETRLLLWRCRDCGSYCRRARS